jgi:multidrug resistance efflux pump
LLRIESPALQAQLLEAERQLEAVKKDYPLVAARQDGHQVEQSTRIRARMMKIDAQVTSLRESVAHFERRLETDQVLERKGHVSQMAVDDSRDSLLQAQRQLASAEVALEQARQDLAALESRWQEDLWQREQLLRGAVNKRDSLAFLLDQTVLKSPEEGIVEALLVRLGDAVQPGQAVGKLISQGAPLQVVAFLAERDRAFATAGDEVHLELDQLPYAEYGTLRARILRIGDDLASPYEIREALGEDFKLDAPTYRVELDVTDASAADAAHIKLRTGMLANVRYTLRRQTLITLVLDPLRRWFR